MMSATIMPTTSPGATDKATINNPADIAVIIGYFVMVIGVGVWVSLFPVCLTCQPVCICNVLYMPSYIYVYIHMYISKTPQCYTFVSQYPVSVC